jgi:hypothetical protein
MSETANAIQQWKSAQSFAGWKEYQQIVTPLYQSFMMTLIPRVDGSNGNLEANLQPMLKIFPSFVIDALAK